MKRFVLILLVLIAAFVYTPAYAVRWEKISIGILLDLDSIYKSNNLIFYDYSIHFPPDKYDIDRVIFKEVGDCTVNKSGIIAVITTYKNGTIQVSDGSTKMGNIRKIKDLITSDDDFVVKYACKEQDLNNFIEDHIEK